MKNIGNLFLVAVFSGAITLGTYKLFLEPQPVDYYNLATETPLIANNLPATNQTRNVNFNPVEKTNFTLAADKAIHSVVHVKSSTTQRVYRDPFDYFFGSGNGGTQRQMQTGSGSGVIISKDGYIVTNNHVVQNASKLEVTLNNNKTYEAKLIGIDSKMDIALLKITADIDLPAMIFGDSDAIQVGEWVLAVGNPYNLTSTVTAGIVSAKARDLSNEGLQSFIQTDAAVNPGNSGGALVNTQGELVGINTMISSPTGSYTGYSFAVPSNITKKIIEDLMQFGNVQRGVLGISGTELNSAIAQKLEVEQTQGFYVNEVTKKSGAALGGIKKGDIIVQLDYKKINTFSDVTAYLTTKRPNDRVEVTVLREGKKQIIPVKLTKKELLVSVVNGIEFEELSTNDKKTYRVSYGIKIKRITNKNISDYAKELESSIVLKIDNMKVKNLNAAIKYLKHKGEQHSQYEILTAKGNIVRLIF